MAECQLPKLNTRVRFPSPAPKRNDNFRKEIAAFLYRCKFVDCFYDIWYHSMVYRRFYVLEEMAI